MASSVIIFCQTNEFVVLDMKRFDRDKPICIDEAAKYRLSQPYLKLEVLKVFTPS